jgi:hypothetical protein
MAHYSTKNESLSATLQELWSRMKESLHL